MTPPFARAAARAADARWAVPTRSAEAWIGGALWPALAALALLLYWLVALGSAPLFDVDEGAFAEASREMLASRDWWHTTLNGADRFDKPIPVYWLQAASLATFGITEFAVRLPSALCAWAWCLATAAFVAPVWGRAAAWSAAAVLATSAGPLLIGRAATADALLNLLIALSMFDLWRYLQDGAARHWRRACVWVALGLLAKGPVAAVVPIGAFVLWALAHREQALRRLRQALRDPWGWLIVAAIALPWYAYALYRHGDAFINGFFVRHNLQRFSSPLENHHGSAVYYLVLLPLLMLPWTPLLVGIVARWRSVWADPSTHLLLGWALFVIGFFSLSGTKLPHYVLYGYTPIAILAGRALANRPRVGAVAVVLCAAGLVLAGAASRPLVGAALQRWGDAHWSSLLAPAGLPAGPGGEWVWPMLAIAGLVAAFRPALSGRAAIVAALSAGVWITAHLVPWWGESLQGPVKALAREAAARDAALVQWKLDQPSAAFYRHLPAPRRAPTADELALTRIDRITGEVAGGSLQIVREIRGLALVRHADGAASR